MTSCGHNALQKLSLKLCQYSTLVSTFRKLDGLNTWKARNLILVRKKEKLRFPIVNDEFDVFVNR